MASVVVSPGANLFDVIKDPAEAEKIREVVALTVKLLDMRYPKPNRILRGVHPKSHGCLKAKFQVMELPPKLSVGLFAQPKAYQAWIRYSNATVRVTPDTSADGTKNESRGMAIKVMDVGEKTLQADVGHVSQDFLMINQPSFAFANLDDYLRVNKISLANFANNEDPTAFFAPLFIFEATNTLPDGVSLEDVKRIAATREVIKGLRAKVTANPLEIQYFSAAPFLFGPDRVMKFSARPVGEPKEQRLPENRSDNYLREAIKATMDKGVDIELDFMVQVRSNGPDLEIEDATTVWEEAQFPFVPVARITIEAPQEILDSPEGMEQCERSVFSPWQCLPEHQPVGSINRLRKEVYLASKTHRGAEALVSLQSVNYTNRFARHRSSEAHIDPLETIVNKRSASFKMVPGLLGTGTTSFESIDLPGYYLRHSFFLLVLNKNDGSKLFKQDATFTQVSGLAGHGVSFRSFNNPTMYIRHFLFRLSIAVPDGSSTFKNDATFNIVPDLASR